MANAVLRLIVATLVGTCLATTAQAQSHSAKPKPPVATELEPVPEPIEQIKTPDQARSESVGGAVTAPLRDLNVVKTEIPAILVQAIADPYARPPAKWTCRQLAALIAPLDAALGPDIDRPPSEALSMAQRGKSTALGLGADLASGAIPFRGIVRRVSGAAARDRLVLDAILAGSVRRAYLKGLGETKACGQQAAPYRMRAAGEIKPTSAKTSAKPKFPTRPGG